MSLPDFLTPTPESIDRVSPTMANQLLGCGLHVAFRRDPNHAGWHRPSEFSALGSAAHAVTESAYLRRDWPDDETELRGLLEAVWNNKIADERTKLIEAWSPSEPPPAEEWPGYHLTRARTIRRCARLISNRQPHKPGEGPRPQVEVALKDRETGLWGRADRIERSGGQMRVVDLKTGLRQAEPTESQRRQLMLYAVLCQREYGEWPTEIAIESASGELTTMLLDPDEAEAALRDVTLAVKGFNRAIGSGHDPLSMARPSVDQCRWCEFRVMCRPYWEHLQSDWDHRSVLGEITGTGETDQGSYVELCIHCPTEHAGADLNISQLASPMRGDARWIAVTDYLGQASSGHVQARWSSQVRAWA